MTLVYNPHQSFRRLSTFGRVKSTKKSPGGRIYVPPLGLRVTQVAYLVNCRISDFLYKNPLCVVLRPRKDVVTHRDFNLVKNVGQRRNTFHYR